MKKSRWKKQHRYWGIVLFIPLCLFCLSGIVLNHPQLFRSLEVGRRWLPADYHYRQWNKGLLRGSIKWGKTTLLYGNNGIWKGTDGDTQWQPFNQGMPATADDLQIKRMVKTRKNCLFALSPYQLYAYTSQQRWQPINIPLKEDDRLSDLESLGDSIIAVSRSALWLLLPPYDQAQLITLKTPQNDDQRVSLFRTVWLLHSGALFGTIGKIIVDGIGFLLLLLAFSGLWYALMPKRPTKRQAQWLLFLGKYHNQVGKLSICLTLLLSLTGWLLRPPGLVALASLKVRPIPFTALDTHQPWNDQLRSLRYDHQQHDFLLYTAKGFYSLSSLQAIPNPIADAPKVSVMGLNVAEQQADGSWLIGSFLGLTRWNRQKHLQEDYFTHQPPQTSKGIPISNHPIIGYLHNKQKEPIIIDYYQGTSQITMPQQLSYLPMSLRNVALEVHTGRIYTFVPYASITYIPLIGLAILWCLWSGWKIRKKRF